MSNTVYDARGDEIKSPAAVEEMLASDHSAYILSWDQLRTVMSCVSPAGMDLDRRLRRVEHVLGLDR